MGLDSIREALKGDTPREPRKRCTGSEGPQEQGQGDLPDNLIPGVMDAIDVTPDPSRTEEDYTHVSSLIHSPCARRFALSRRYGSDDLNAVSRGQRLIWALGRSAEDHVRKGLIKGIPENVFGKWTCPCGHMGIEGTAQFAYSYRKCSRCRQYPRVYQEYTLFNVSHGTVGNPDIILRFNELNTIAETKSINSKGFDKLKSKMFPESDHCLQA